jgi:diadenylate cyclase
MMWTESLSFALSQFRWQDLVDIILVWIIVYQLFILIRKTGTVQVLSGLGFLALVYLASIWLELFTFNWLLDKFFSNLFLIVVVLFQAEIRRALAHIGANPFFTEVSQVREVEIVEEIIRGVADLLRTQTGVLIVIERDIFLDYHIEVGTLVQAQVSAELLGAIFNPSSPMHDGAVLIRGGRIFSAGNVLPLSKNPFLDKNLGTRHRAAVGLSEETDAIVIILSEENQDLSMALGGVIKPLKDIGELRRCLFEELEIFEK